MSAWILLALPLLSACAGEKDEPTALESADTAFLDTSTPLSWFQDRDDDGYGSSVTTEAVEAPTGYVAVGGDCDDAAPGVHPGAEELCDTVDQDCDGVADEDLPTRQWHPDGDADGWGDSGAAIEACGPPTGAVATAGDCDDTNASVHPGAEEVCGNGADDDCFGDADARCGPSGEQYLSAAPWRVTGEDDGANMGWPVTLGGDADGDGRPDMLLGASEQGAGGPGGAWWVPALPDGNWEVDRVGSRLWGEVPAWYDYGALAFLVDQDGDGLDEVLVGAPSESAAYVFSNPNAGDQVVSEASTSVLADDVPGFGSAAISFAGGTLVTAARANFAFEGRVGWKVGRAYVFETLEPGVYTHEIAVATISPDVGHEYGQFGQAVCSGDFDGDGVGDVAIGATAPYPEHYEDFLEGGAVYVVQGPFAGEMQVADADGTLRDASARVESDTPDELLGTSVSCGGDVDGDGLHDLLVGAPGGAGAARLYTGPPSGTLGPGDANLTIVGGTEGEGTGVFVTLESDLNGDGRSDTVVGSYGVAAEGRVALFYGGEGGGVGFADADATWLGVAPGDYAAAVAGGGDLDSDGFDDLLIGAGGVGETDRGEAYVVFGGRW